MPRASLRRPFTVASYSFLPAASGSAKLHKLRVPLKFTGRDPAAVVDWATRVRGEPLLVRFNMKDGAGPVDAVGRLEGAAVRILKGSKKPPVVLRLAFESEEVVQIESVLLAGLRAARAGLLELDLELRLVQEPLPGMEEEPEVVSELKMGPDDAAELEAASNAAPKKLDRRLRALGAPDGARFVGKKPATRARGRRKK